MFDLRAIGPGRRAGRCGALGWLRRDGLRPLRQAGAGQRPRDDVPGAGVETAALPSRAAYQWYPTCSAARSSGIGVVLARPVVARGGERPVGSESLGLAAGGTLFLLEASRNQRFAGARRGLDASTTGSVSFPATRRDPLWAGRLCLPKRLAAGGSSRLAANETLVRSEPSRKQRLTATRRLPDAFAAGCVSFPATRCGSPLTGRFRNRKRTASGG